ncbi:L,D-transpeptidase [Patescibacteria group bacterium]
MLITLLALGCGEIRYQGPSREELTESIRKIEIPDFPEEEIELPNNRTKLLYEEYVTDVNYDPSPIEYLDFSILDQIPDQGNCILIDCRCQRLWVWEDRQIIGYFVCSTGRYSLPTKVGRFDTGRKFESRGSNTHVEDGLNKWWQMDWFVDMNYSGNGFHALTHMWNMECYREDIQTLGRPVSHGCVRTGHIELDCLGGKSPAKWVWDHVEEGDNPFTWPTKEGEGTPVIVVGVYRGNIIPKDIAPGRKFSTEIGFYFEELEE